MKEYKKKYKMYSTWHYEQELEDINKETEKG